MKVKKIFALLSTLVIVMSMIGILPAVAASGVVRQIPNGDSLTAYGKKHPTLAGKAGVGV
jgi:hypothetical protein